MAYWKDTWELGSSNEIEYKFAGKYGAKGEKRAKRKKATPEQIKKQNRRNREKYIRRLIKANFVPDDLWCTLKYPKGARPPLKEVRKDMERFLKGLRRAYGKRGNPLKYIYRMEIGRRGGIHIHILVNRIRGDPGADVLIRKHWKPGRVHYESIYEQGGYEQLACYIVKEPCEEMQGQLSLFPEAERKKLRSYSCSRNLVRPQPERKVYGRRTMRKLLEEGPVATPGYYIDPESVVSGTNPYTGMSYLHYTEYRLGSTERREDDGHEDGGSIRNDGFTRQGKRRRARDVPPADGAVRRKKVRE